MPPQPLEGCRTLRLSAGHKIQQVHNAGLVLVTGLRKPRNPFPVMGDIRYEHKLLRDTSITRFRQNSIGFSCEKGMIPLDYFKLVQGSLSSPYKHDLCSAVSSFKCGF